VPSCSDVDFIARLYACASFVAVAHGNPTKDTFGNGDPIRNLNFETGHSTVMFLNPLTPPNGTELRFQNPHAGIGPDYAALVAQRSPIQFQLP
jgi:hypothetical protein